MTDPQIFLFSKKKEKNVSNFSTMFFLIKDNAGHIIQHVYGWTLFICATLVFANYKVDFPFLTIITSGKYLQFCSYYLFIFYVHSFILVPQFLAKKKYFGYFSAVAIMFGGIYLLHPFTVLTSAKNLKEIGSKVQLDASFDAIAFGLFLTALGFSSFKFFFKKLHNRSVSTLEKINSKQLNGKKNLQITYHDDK